VCDEISGQYIFMSHSFDLSIAILRKYRTDLSDLYFEVFIHRDGFRSPRAAAEGETIRVKWPKFSQQISLTKIQSRLVAIEGCIVGPWKMAVGNNRIMSFALGDGEAGETGK